MSDHPNFRMKSPATRMNHPKSGPSSQLMEIGIPEFRKTRNSVFWVFRFSGCSENREIKKSGKKASDVEFTYVEFPLRSKVIR